MECLIQAQLLLVVFSCDLLLKLQFIVMRAPEYFLQTPFEDHGICVLDVKKYFIIYEGSPHCVSHCNYLI